MEPGQFKQQVYRLVETIPEGRVMTYGTIAAICGQASAARIVGGIAHFGPSDLPWHRVVNRHGALASGYPGGKETHKKHLEAEGITISEYIVDNFEALKWYPKLNNR